VIADRERLTPYLRLAAGGALNLDFGRVVAYTRALTIGLALAPRLDHHPRVLDLVLNLAFAHTLDADRELGDTRDLDLDLALDLALDFAGIVTPAEDRDLDRALELAHVLGLDLPFDRFRAKHRAIRHALDLAPELGLGGSHSSTETDRADILRDALTHIAEDPSTVLNGSYTAENALARADAFARDVDRTRDRHVSSLDPSLAVALERDLAHDQGLTLGLDLVPGAATLRAALLTFDGLARLWTPSRYKRPKSGVLLADFDSFLVNLVAEPREVKDPVPEDPTIPLQRARDLMGAPPRHPIPDPESWNRARVLAEQAQTLIGPLMDRTVPYAEFTLACARMALLTAAVLVTDVHEDDIPAYLLEALRGLAALSERANGHLRPNEVLLLVRI
jgi:hypothetical protein